MSDFLSLLTTDFILYALAAGLSLALVAGPLGSFIVWRRMAYFGDSDLLGNGLLPSTNYGVEDNVGEIQESGLYEARRKAVYSHPDQTKNEVGLLSLNFQNFIDDETQITGLIYSRYGRQKRLGGDVEAEFATAENEWEFEGEFNNSKTRQNGSGLGLNLSKILDNHQITAGLTFDQSTERKTAKTGGEVGEKEREGDGGGGRTCARSVRDPSVIRP